MKYALIGCGRISINHIKAAAANGLTISAVCDVVAERAEASLTALGSQSEGVRRYTDYRLMLEDIKPDIVAIATESGKHAAIALDCIDAGCHILVEKPIALSINDAEQIISRAKTKGVKVCACHQNRFNHSVRYLRKALEDGRFGKLSHGCVHVRWNRDEEYYKQAPWRGTWEQDGGALMNQSIHAIDLLRWMMGGEIEEVSAYTAQRFHPYIQCEDIGAAVVKFDNGAIGLIEGTTNVFPKNLEETLYIFGEYGTVKLGGKSMNTIETWMFADNCPEDEALSSGFMENVANVYGNGHISLYADMIHAVQSGRDPSISGESRKKALELVLAIYLSAQKGMPVKLPLENCGALDFIGEAGQHP